MWGSNYLVPLELRLATGFALSSGIVALYYGVCTVQWLDWLFAAWDTLEIGVWPVRTPSPPPTHTSLVIYRSPGFIY